MTNNTTLSVHSASSRTWIFTFLINTSQIWRAFAITDAFRSTIRRRANVFCQTWTGWGIVNNSTLWIGTAGGWLTRILFWNIFNCNIFEISFAGTFLVSNNILIAKHLTNGSPVNLSGQLQTGLWFTTWQIAPIPQVPGQGSIHFWLLHAWMRGHSELCTHSGLQFGGVPK